MSDKSLLDSIKDAVGFGDQAPAHVANPSAGATQPSDGNRPDPFHGKVARPAGHPGGPHEEMGVDRIDTGRDQVKDSAFHEAKALGN